MVEAKQKPELSLIRADSKTLTAEDLAALYEKLTGEKSTPQEVKAMREELKKR